MAVPGLGNGDEAVGLFHLLTPINHTRSAADVERYKAEPYVTAGDVYAHPAHAGRGGWTWDTGSPGWMYPIGKAHVRTPVTSANPMPASAFKKKKIYNRRRVRRT